MVHIGCDRGERLADLGARPGLILHVLDRDPVKVKRARTLLLSRGLYGKISVDLFDGQHLPYAENLVNLVIVDDPQLEIPRLEILRVLVPNGVALINGRKIQKPMPPDIDEWSHFEHGPENNAVAADTAVGPPRHLKWVAGPRWLRTHEEPSGVSSMVTAGARLFYTLDVFDEQDDPLGALEGRKGGVLRAVAAKDGSTLSEYILCAPPVLDGLIAVDGKLFLATRDGKLSCWE